MKRNKTREERRLATKFKMAWIAGAIMWVFILLLLLGSIPKRSATSGANTDSARGSYTPLFYRVERGIVK